MNIKNRLAKIESQIVIADSNFCNCENEIHLIVPSLTHENGFCRHCQGACQHREGSLCDKCGKPFLTKTIKPKVVEHEH